MRTRFLLRPLSVVLTLGVGAVLHAQTAAAPDAAPAVAVTPAADVQGGVVTGVVTSATVADANGKKPAGVPLPGVTVTATNTLTGKKYAAATDVAGSFRMNIPRNGRYVLRAEFAAFAPTTAEVLLNATQHSGSADFAMELASRSAAARPQATDVAGLAVAVGLSAADTQALGRGLQSLSASGSGDTEAASAGGGAAGAALPTLGALGGDAGGTDSVAVSGQAGQTNGLAGFNEDEVRDRIQTAIADAQRNGGAQADVANAVIGLVGGLIAGGPGGFGGGGFQRGGGGGGRGGFRNFNPSAIHGNLFYQAGNGALDATQFSITGNAAKPAYSTNRYGVSFVGSPYIPGLTKPNAKQNLFLNLTGQRNENPVNIYATVPTLSQRAGNFNGLTQTVNGVVTPVLLYNPATGQTYGDCSAPTNASCNVIANGLSPQAQALLQYIPTPNSSGTGTTSTAENYNYQRITTAGSNSAQLSARFQRSLGSAAAGPGGGFGGRGGGGGGGQQSTAMVLRQSVNVSFSYSHNASDQRGLLAALDGKTQSNGYNLSTGYTLGYGRISNSLTLGWNYSHAMTTNLFTYGSVDPATLAGINVPKPATARAGLYSGVPDLSFTNYSGINETNPADRLGETFSIGDVISYRRGKHNYRFGFDGRRVHSDLIAGTNGIGQFTFTGFATQKPGSTGGTAQAPSGSSFADFLLGAPQTSGIQAGANKIYLRQWVYDGYAQDDWRVLSNVTLNVGLRYEYFSPYVEQNNRLVNLDHNADFTQFSRVLAGGSGTFNGDFPRSLIQPDRSLFSPRLGIAWRPMFLKNTVVRGGYGINFNTGQYGSFANSLSYQQPFAVTQNNVANSQGCGNLLTASTTNSQTFTLANAYGCTSSSVLQNTFAVNRDYRLGRVQAINMDIQHQLGLGIVMNVGYNGAFGSSLDLRRAPNRSATAVLSNAQAIVYEDSIGDSRFHSLSVNMRKRLQKGIAVGATYQYGHSIDDASSIGGAGNNTVVQNDQRIDLEFGNSTFDVRHKLNGNFVAELPFGPNRAFLAQGGWLSRSLDGISLSGDYNFATGTYATPQYQNSVAQAASGNNYTLRPDRVFTQGIGGAGTLRSWFNTAAFAAPANVFGTASRNSIQLPGTVSVNMSLSKTVSFGDLRSFEGRLTANNAFNTVQYSGINTTLNSSTFGQVTGTAAPRKLTLQARYRF